MTTAAEAQAEIARRAKLELARRSLLHFMRAVWWEPGPFYEGRHTKAIARRLTQVVDDYKGGKSTFLVIQVPFRHGKSDLVSRALPPFFLGACHAKSPDVIMSTYAAELAESFSRKVKSIMASPAYQDVFPCAVVSRQKYATRKWNVEGSSGEVTVAGLKGQIMGFGGDLIIVDDYCKQREAAESETIRDTTWENFRDIMTRRAPVSIVVICATPWHVDDVIGRLRDNMAEDIEFPRFEFMTFPAISEDYAPEKYLFPERFDDAWYTTQFATLGRYSAAALLQCDPQRRGGNMIDTTHVRIHESLDEFPDAPYTRFWDLASTEKERVKDDPDSTVGALVSVTRDAQSLVDHLWVKDLVIIQAEAPKRDTTILATAERDGAAVGIAVESVAGYKDTYANVKKILRGKRMVTKVEVSVDKVVRAAPLEPLFEAGNVHLLKAGWNARFLTEFTAFPSGKHDDVVDAVSGGYAERVKAIPMMAGINRSELGL